MTYLSRNLARLSEWIDAPNAHRDPEAILWGRVAKIAEEGGEAIGALVGLTGQNPRKGVTHTASDVISELLDVATTALGAVEHLTGNGGASVGLLDWHVAAVVKRAGIVSGEGSSGAPVADQGSGRVEMRGRKDHG